MNPGSRSAVHSGSALPVIRMPRLALLLRLL